MRCNMDIQKIDAAEQSSINFLGNDQSISRDNLRLQEVGDQISPFHQSIKLDESTISREQNTPQKILQSNASFNSKVGKARWNSSPRNTAALLQASKSEAVLLPP